MRPRRPRRGQRARGTVASSDTTPWASATSARRGSVTHAGVQVAEREAARHQPPSAERRGGTAKRLPQPALGLPGVGMGRIDL